MSRKHKDINTEPMAARQLEAIVRQIARVKNGEKPISFTLNELDLMREDLLVELNGG